MAPGLNMGSLKVMQVVEQRVRIALDRSGKYSKFAQLKRLVLLAQVADDDEVQAELDDLEETDGG